MRLIIVILLTPALTACIPRIEVAPPKEPVTINMNVKIDHDIHVKMDDQVKTLLERDEGILPANSTSHPSSADKNSERTSSSAEKE